MPTSRKRRSRQNRGTSEMITAILAGGPLEYTPERHAALIGWAFFNEPPAGCELLTAPFPVLEQLEKWHEEQLEYEHECRRSRRGA